MGPPKRKRPVQGRPSNKVAAQDGSGDLESSDSASLKQATVTPFSTEMFQQLSSRPYDDTSQLAKVNTVIHIRPQSIWASLHKYINLVIHEQVYAVHQYALISRSQPLPKLSNPLEIDAGIPCPARILEIRALDPSNVYVRVYWLYTPEQIPGSRQPYHGRNELIVTNHMEIVDAARVIAPFEVFKWNGEGEDFRRVLEGEKFWRQTYHILTQEISVSRLSSRMFQRLQ
ncbi:MAG: hypothetical protein Q9166_003836 [cf. Caloplaca sp. 2 TL-2023]